MRLAADVTPKEEEEEVTSFVHYKRQLHNKCSRSARTATAAARQCHCQPCQPPNGWLASWLAGRWMTGMRVRLRLQGADKLAE